MNSLDLQSELPLTTKMDHRPARAELFWRRAAAKCARVDKPMLSLPKGRFDTTHQHNTFQNSMVTPEALSLDLQHYEQHLFQVGLHCFTDEAGKVSTPKESCKRRLRESRIQIRFEECPNEIKKLMNSLWACIRKLRKIRIKKQLDSLKKVWSRDFFTPASVEINGQVSYNREEWLGAALEIGKCRFTDTGNDIVVQLERLEQLYSHSQAQSLDGIKQPALKGLGHFASKSGTKSRLGSRRGWEYDRHL